jgi:hypothetical protein
MNIVYTVYECKEGTNVWTLVESFDTQEEASTFSKKYAEGTDAKTIIEVQDGGRH